jgi:hypothetical protein
MEAQLKKNAKIGGHSLFNEEITRMMREVMEG